MKAFLDAALAFPTVVFSLLLLVVAGYWVVVMVGALDVDSADGDGDAGDGGVLSVVGLGGVPVTVAVSLLVAVAWFASLSAGALVHGFLEGRGARD